MPPDLIRRLLENPPDLPVRSGLPALEIALREQGVAVMQAPPGTGKTTLVPPAVAAMVAGGGRVVVTQPRRIAARAAARRLASLLGERVGQTVGHTVRGDRAVGPDTRIEFVTTGVLLRRLQRDPELPGVAAVVLDEVHERQLDADLALAFLVDVRATVRDDLLLVAMSATVEAERTAATLAASTTGPVPVVDVPGALHPVTTHWAPPPPGVLPTDERGVPPRFLDHVAATVRHAVSTDPGDVLVFVPGVGEVDGVMRRLSGLGDVDVLALHGRLPAQEQDRALTQGARRRIVVSTAVAESSLTVPGVRIVVDAGLSREPRTDQVRGLPALVTVRVSRSAAEQRAGRAGREAPGVVHRCWSRADHAHLPAHPAPEIAVADLTGFCLELAAWGDVDGASLALLDPPPPPALETARQTLVGLGAIDATGAITDRGRAMAQVPADPRLARALLDGAEAVGAHRAAEVVALLDDDVRAPGGDLVAALRGVRRGGPAARSWAEAVARLESLLPTRTSRTGLTDDLAVGTVVALAHPGRIARRRSGGGSYLMVSGTGAAFRAADPSLAGLPWIAIADAERRPGARDATIRSAAPITEDIALDAASGVWQEADEVTWAGGRIVARRVTRLGAIELSAVPLADPPPDAVAAAVADGLSREGLAMLPWSEAAVALRRRMAFLHDALGEPWPDVGDEALLTRIDAWLGADLARVRGSRDLGRIDVLSALRRLLPWPAAGRLDELAPERVTLPNGKGARVEYGATGTEQPVLSVRLQDAFGWTATPRIADGRVPLLLHLLTPARRPAAVTADLESFWAGPYRQVRAELRGRYPKHAWPEDPTQAQATGARRT
ncbi:ATP-dependent helicase HrpB [Aeromicrobium wangtongii]|uniref:RNA helicase n=1 Tax=Aeromicrobium wangtongii TaxID=2969247 RepID=A0ABY5M794_9ACTN|nr:ATP-dependent helicase HrpB [Aeromicrobium wangtongii]MCD9199344.1 ATP-dependent helicase HrpB [Aeromicrobium wangtongii]UUP13702.1 ATP-dependent helicase HrpB [Aeromicrobium wangtongii]